MASGGVMPYAELMADFNVNKFLGANIRRIRRKTHDATQEEFAVMLDTSQSTLSLWETGERMPRLKELIAKLEHAGLDPRDLFLSSPAGEDDEEIDPDIARVVSSLRDLPREIRQTIAQLADSLRLAIPRDYDAESAELVRLLARIDVGARAGILAGIRQLLVATAPPNSSFDSE